VHIQIENSFHEYGTERKTARETLRDRQVEKKANTHDTNSHPKKASRSGMCIRETETIIGTADPQCGVKILLPAIIIVFIYLCQSLYISYLFIYV